jgi:hypothetical protein
VSIGTQDYLILARFAAKQESTIKKITSFVTEEPDESNSIVVDFVLEDIRQVKKFLFFVFKIHYPLTAVVASSICGAEVQWHDL